ncbi:hypothetical protein ABPG72_003749 [Tetrahymena utriculariae]
MGNINESNNMQENIPDYVKAISHFTYNKCLNQLELQNTITLDSRIYLKKNEKIVDSNSLTKLGEGLSNLTNLRHISIILRECKFNEESVQSLAKGISSLINLENLEIEISSCELNVSQCISIMKEIMKMTWLNSLTLNLTKNELTNEGVIQLSQYITKMPQLKELQLFLKGNHFNEKGVFHISEMLNNLLNLKVIFVDIENKYKQLESTINDIERKNDSNCGIFDSGDDTS